MGFAKLENPTPSASKLGPLEVAVVARGGMKGSRYIVVKIGSEAARKAGFARDKHKCHLMVGDGDDRGKVAISIDDTQGKFAVKRTKAGFYQMTVTSRAATGIFSLEFPPFSRDASVISAGQTGPLVIIFEATADFLKGGK